MRFETVYFYSLLKVSLIREVTSEDDDSVFVDDAEEEFSQSKKER